MAQHGGPRQREGKKTYAGGREADITDWKRWQLTQKEIYRRVKQSHGEERYLRWGSRQAVVLKMLFRTGHANLRANKFEGREARCQLCDLKEAESEAHVLLRCRRFDPQRADLD